MNNIDNSEKIILDLCGGTGAWSKPYKEANYDVRLITLPEYDVQLYKSPNNVYGILAAPPCTAFAVSGARWWGVKGDNALIKGLNIVDACMRIILITNPHFWCLENPVGRLKRYIGNYKLIFNPCDYGDAYTKKTCLWGEFNIPVKNQVEPIYYYYDNGKKRGSWYYCKTGGNSERTKILRSITPAGFAKAFFEVNR